jgi:ABC-2 type transport system permease protein
MNTSSNAIPDTFDAQRIAPAATSPARIFYWSVRRELWENRSIYVAPLAVGAVFLLGFVLSLIHFPAKMRAALAVAPLQQHLQQHPLIEQPYTFAELLIMATALLVAVFCCLDALHGERRDRSILFWKSLPVSDLTTVLSKASIPILILPLLAFAITVVMKVIMLLLSSAVLQASGLSAATLWAHVPLLRTSGMLFYHLVVFHGLWYAPIYAWLLLVSAWARRFAFLWAALPLIAIGLVEKVAFNTKHFATLLEYRVDGGPNAPVLTGGMSAHSSTLGLAGFLVSPGMLIGLAIAAAFLAAAVRVRRYQGPI